MASSTFLGLAVLTIALLYPARKYIWPARVAERLDPSYDYIVVGAGSAGCVVASRLSEEADVSVAVLEAGDDVNLHPAARVPLASFSLQKTRADWNYTTVSQKKALNAMKDNVLPWPRGKLLGGTGQFNSMWYVRGHRHDYDRPLNPWTTMTDKTLYTHLVMIGIGCLVYLNTVFDSL